jgi:hypothetical protein
MAQNQAATQDKAQDASAPKRLHMQTRVHLLELQSQTGHALGVDDLDDVLELDRLWHKITADDRAERNAVYSCPIRCGAVMFYPPTLGGWLWLEAHADWFPTQLLAEGAAALVCACGRDIERLEGLDSPGRARREVRRLIKASRLTPKELSLVVSWFVSGDDSDGSAGDDKHDLGPVIALLCREYGNTPHYWLHEAEAATVGVMLADWTRRKSAEIDAYNRQAAQNKVAKAIINPVTAQLEIDARKVYNRIKGRWAKDG